MTQSPDSKPPNTPNSDAAFEKRLKRRVSGRRHTFFAVCAPGLVSICRKELQELKSTLELLGLLPAGQSIEAIDILPGGVSFMTRLDLACLAHLFLGTPTRILMRVDQFKADRFSALEKKISAIDWELFLPAHCRVEIQVSTQKSRLYHSDAVAQRCRAILEKRLGTAKTGADDIALTVMIRARDDRFEISLDMSGVPLFKRGIKEKVIAAPLRETLAFAMLRNRHFSPGDLLVDPMCGSGTFSLEAALIQAQIPPGFFRTFAFEKWPGFQARRFDHAKTRIQDAVQTRMKALVPGQPLIFASDMDGDAVKTLETTLDRHDFLKTIRVQHQDFFELSAPKLPPGFSGKKTLLLNPPYGKRLGKDLDLEEFFKEIGKKLSSDFKGWQAGIICPRPQLLKALNPGLAPMPLFHGGLDLVAAMGPIR